MAHGYGHAYRRMPENTRRIVLSISTQENVFISFFYIILYREYYKYDKKSNLFPSQDPVSLYKI